MIVRTVLGTPLQGAVIATLSQSHQAMAATSGGATAEAANAEATDSFVASGGAMSAAPEAPPASGAGAAPPAIPPAAGGGSDEKKAGGRPSAPQPVIESPEVMFERLTLAQFLIRWGETEEAGDVVKDLVASARTLDPRSSSRDRNVALNLCAMMKGFGYTEWQRMRMLYETTERCRENDPLDAATLYVELRHQIKSW